MIFQLFFTIRACSVVERSGEYAVCFDGLSILRRPKPLFIKHIKIIETRKKKKSNRSHIHIDPSFGGFWRDTR